MTEQLKSDAVIDITKDLVSLHTPTLIAGEPVETNIATNFREMYRRVVRTGEILGGNHVYNTIWEIDGRPILVASNNPVPQRPENLKDWQIDLGILVHGDTASSTEEGAKNTYEENGWIYGPGAGDMKWAAIPAIAAIANTGQKTSIGFIMYTNEERGGQDIGYLVKQGFAPRIALCADGAPLKEGEGTMSIVSAGKGGFRIRLAGEKEDQYHASRPHQRSLAFNIASVLHGLEELYPEEINKPLEVPFETVSFNPIIRSGEDIARTEKSAELLLDVRAGTEENRQKAREVIEALAKINHLDSNLIGQRNIFRQDMTDPAVILYKSIAEEAVGKGNLRISKDYGTNDLVHLPLDISRILGGIRGDKWHGDLKERVPVEAIGAYLDTYVEFARRLPELSE